VTLAGLSASKLRNEKMLTERENDNCICLLPRAREEREDCLAIKHASERRSLEHLEKMASFIEEAMANFLAETPGKPIVDLTLSSPETPSKIFLRIDDNGKLIDVSGEPFPF
jgi:hypothetical protein